ncbi:hypothetical protein [Glycomyces sp. NPDC047010]|uniref:hypothetical protein n=1 Tax=Glycomyces sp. NPDC047010 TaxID=3155023 RepID=UPI0033F309B0
MYGLPQCACGGTVFNDDTGKCDDCSAEDRIAELETEAERLQERTASLQQDLDRSRADLERTEAHIGELEFLLRLGAAQPLDDLAAALGPGGCFRVCRADQILPGDRMLCPVRAVTAARASLVVEELVVLELAGGARKEAAAAQRFAVWTPPNPHQPCTGCARPLFCGCSPGCPADGHRAARLALALNAAEWPEPGRYRPPSPHRPAAIQVSTAHTTLRGEVTGWEVSVRLRPAAWATGWPGIDAMHARLARAMDTLPDPVDAAQFTVTDASLDCRDGEWDLACAAAVLTAYGRTDPERVAGARLWARVEPDGALQTPNGHYDKVAALAQRSGHPLVTAADRSHCGATEDVLAFATLTEAAAWMARPPRP